MKMDILKMIKENTIDELRQSLKMELKEGLLENRIDNISISRLIAYMNKLECATASAYGELRYDNIRDSVIKKALLKSGQVYQDSHEASGQDDAPKDDASQDGDCQDDAPEIEEYEAEAVEDAKSSSKCKADYEVFTSVGTKSLDKFKDDLNIDANIDVEAIKNRCENAVTIMTAEANAILEDCKAQVGKTHKVELISGKKVVSQEGKVYHPKFQQIHDFVKLGWNVYLYGEAGTGKTTMGKMLAETLNLNFGFTSCNEESSKAEFTGLMNVQGDFINVDFLRIFENGGVFLLDEIDRANSNTMTLLNKALEQGEIDVPMRKEKPYAKAHKDFVCICAGNTTGTGNGSETYTGANKLDRAFLDRFTMVHYDYDSNLEKFLVGEHKIVKEFLDALRERAKAKNIDHIISTRLYKKGNEFFSSGMTIEGKSTLRAFAENVVCPIWSDREIRKVELNELINMIDKDELDS